MWVCLAVGVFWDYVSFNMYTIKPRHVSSYLQWELHAANLPEEAADHECVLDFA